MAKGSVAQGGAEHLFSIFFSVQSLRKTSKHVLTASAALGNVFVEKLELCPLCEGCGGTRLLTIYSSCLCT